MHLQKYQAASNEFPAPIPNYVEIIRTWIKELGIP